MNGISGDGCIALSAMLQNNDSLIHLNISNSRIKDLDAVAFVQALHKNESLKSLIVSIKLLYIHSDYMHPQLTGFSSTDWLELYYYPAGPVLS